MRAFDLGRRSASGAAAASGAGAFLAVSARHAVHAVHRHHCSSRLEFLQKSLKRTRVRQRQGAESADGFVGHAGLCR